jgi:hypothetical protein
MAEPEDQWPDGLDVRSSEKEERDLYIKFKNWQYGAIWNAGSRPLGAIPGGFCWFYNTTFPRR